MFLSDDIESIKKSWDGLPPIGKLIFGTSFVITFFSFASLADSVYELKGFIINAIHFYRWATDPLLSITESLNITLTRISLDGIILVLIFGRGIYKYTVGLGMKTIGRSYLYLLCPGLIVIFILFPSEWAFNIVLLMNVEYFIRLILIYIWSAYSDPNKDFLYTGIKIIHIRDVMLKSIFRFLFPLVLFAVIAAISEGITRPL